MKTIWRMTIRFAALAALILSLALAAGCQGAAQANGAGLSLSPDAAKAAYAAGVDNGASTGISVTGQGSVTVKPDVATITLGVETTDADAGRARKANNDAMDKALKAVKALGVEDADITTTNFNIYPTYDDKGQKITGYRVYNTVSVRVKSLEKLGAILTAATDAGANTSYGITFDVLDRTAAYNEALKQAMAKAKARADIMAGALGVKVGKAVTINESSSYSGPVYAEAAAAAMDSNKSIAVPTQSGTMDITATVSVVYEILK